MFNFITKIFRSILMVLLGIIAALALIPFAILWIILFVPAYLVEEVWYPTDGGY